jgi:hypothetical protein
MNEAVPLYDPFSADYDRFVNWEERLAGAGLAPAQGDRKGSPLRPDLNTPNFNVR